MDAFVGQAGDKSEHMSIFISVGSAGDRVLSNHIQCRLKKQKKIHAESNVRGPSPERERPHRNVCSPLSVGNFFFFPFVLRSLLFWMAFVRALPGQALCQRTSLRA